MRENGGIFFTNDFNLNSFVESFSDSEPTVKDVHKCKIYFDTKNPYFKFNKRRVRLNEC